MRPGRSSKDWRRRLPWPARDHPRLAAVVDQTNCIESIIPTVCVVTGLVKKWENGEMKKRWIATGMIEAQRNFRRVRRHTHMAQLATLIGHAVNPATPANYAQDVF